MCVYFLEIVYHRIVRHTNVIQSAVRPARGGEGKASAVLRQQWGCEVSAVRVWCWDSSEGVRWVQWGCEVSAVRVWGKCSEGVRWVQWGGEERLSTWNNHRSNCAKDKRGCLVHEHFCSKVAECQEEGEEGQRVQAVHTEGRKVKALHLVIVDKNLH